MRAGPRLRNDLLGYLRSLTDRYGDVVALPARRQPIVLVNDPDGVRRVLQDNHRGYDKATAQYAALAAVTGDGLLTGGGDGWLRHRRILQPAFHHSQLATVLDSAVRAGDTLAGRWAAGRAGATVDVEPELSRAGFAVLAGVLGGDAARLAGPVVKAVDQATLAMVRLAPLPGWLPAPARRRRRAAVAVLDRACRELLAADGSGIVSLLLAAQRGGELSEREVRDELVTLLVAGHETVASTLTWTLRLLAEHPQAQQRLHDELDQVLAGRPPGRQDLPALRWTRAVLDESLRLYPPAWLLTRRALAADRVAGVALAAGTVVVISPWLLHRRADCWPEPECFRPQRFLDVRGRDGGYLPFGAGPRLCIGRDLALVECTVLLARLLGRVRLAPPPGERWPRVVAGVTLRPQGGLRLLIGPR